MAPKNNQKSFDSPGEIHKLGFGAGNLAQSKSSGNNAPLYNSRIIRNYIEYVERYYSDVDVNELLQYADMKFYQVDDEGHWFTQKQSDRFHEILTAKIDNPDISREVGRFTVTSKSSGALRQYLLGFISPATAYAVVEKINTHLSRAAVLKIKSTQADHVEATATISPNVVEQPYQCQYRLGALEAVAKIFTGKFANIEHPICLHKNGDCCLYKISWEKTRTFFWKQIRNYSFIISIIVCILLWKFVPSILWDLLVLSCVLLVMSLALYTEHLEKRELFTNIRNQGDAASRLLEQINVSYNNALLIQEIGQVSSSVLDIDRLLAFIVEALEKRLDYERGMIMLVNNDKTRITYTIGFGYKPEQREYLKNIEFHLDKSESRGPFVISFKQQIPFLINDIHEIETDLSARSLDFAKKMGTHSFICVPIAFKKESIGILVVDNIRSERIFSQSDMNLLTGIANQIAISINNAISYRKIMESEKRFRSLSETAPDIIYTIDNQGIFSYVNPAWERILGHRSKDVLGRYFIDFVRKEDIPLYVDMFTQIRDEGGTVQDGIGVLVHKDGSDRFFSISGAPNFDSEGNMIGVVGIFKDVTDLKLSETKLQSSHDKLQSALDSTIQTISKIVESRDPFTAGHQERVARLAAKIAEEMAISEEFVASIRMAATLHDVGKINIPAEILSKPSKLNHIEIGMIRIHPKVGHDILQSIEFPYPISQIILQHHERMDGSGYPAGISGENILIEARILAVADVVEAMASHRPYRPAFSVEEALEEIMKHKGTLYDGTVVDICFNLFQHKRFHF